MRSSVVGLVLSLVLAAGTAASAQSPLPTGDGAVDTGPTREEAVALVLASDPRFADLPDFEVIRRVANAEFRTVEAILMSDWYRVLGPAQSELADTGWASFRHPTGWLIEISLVEACTEPPAGVEPPRPDPCAWRHSWYHLVSPDGSVRLVDDWGDPDPATATAAPPVDVAAEAPARMPGIWWNSGLVSLNADSMRLVAGDTVFTGRGHMVDIESDPGDAAYRTLEMEWIEQGAVQRVNLYLAADETHWWVDSIRTSDGSAEGHWIAYRGPLFRTPVGESFYGDVHLVSDLGPVHGELTFDGLLLRPRFHLDFGGPDAASPAPE